jgi:hypothetical protein
MVFRILEHDHEQLSELLRDLKVGLQLQDHSHTFALLDLFWARLAVHIRAENLCLFPAILNAPAESFRNEGVPPIEEARATIDSLRSDHNFFMDELARAVKTFREILAIPQSAQRVTEQLETIRERVDAVARRLESHNVLEEDQVYKWPGIILTTSDLEHLRASLRRELENLPRRFTAQ